MPLKLKLSAALVILLLLLEISIEVAGAQEMELQQFLANRPPISRILFLRTTYTNGLVSKSQFYEGGWNNEDFYVKDFAVKSQNAESFSSLVTNLQSSIGAGKEGARYWTMSSSNDLTQAELPPQAALDSNPVVAHALNKKLILEKALNLGIDMLKTGTLKWNGDTFVGEFEDGIVKVGEVTINLPNGAKKIIAHPQIFGQVTHENGKISGIKVSHFTAEFGVTYSLNYTYNSSNPLPRKLPNAIIKEAINFKTGKEEPVEGIGILSIEFADTNTQTLAYSITNHSLSTNNYSFLLSNNQYYAFSSNGSLRLVNMTYKPPASKEKIGRTKFMIVGFMALSIIGLFSFLYFGIKSNKQNKTQQ